MAEDMELELRVMGEVAKALDSVSAKAAARILKWALDRLTEKNPDVVQLVTPIPPLPTLVQPQGESGKSQDFSDLPGFFHALNPSTEGERALVVGYWFQVKEGQDSFYSYSVNTRLKNIGYPIGNITMAFNSLMEATPKLVIQIARGDSQQARKQLRLTDAGIRKVEGMIPKKG